MKFIHIISIVSAILFTSYQSQAQSSHISIGDMTVDGLNVKNLDCQLKDGNFMALLTVVTSLAQAKDAYAACHLSQTPFSAEWTWGTQTKAQIDPQLDSVKATCAKKAIEQTKGPSGTCKAAITAP